MEIFPIRGPCALSTEVLSAVRPPCAGMTAGCSEGDSSPAGVIPPGARSLDDFLPRDVHQVVVHEARVRVVVLGVHEAETVLLKRR